MYYQNYIELFNECNPAGDITSNEHYTYGLIFAMSLGVLVAVKRFWIGLRLGKASYSRYAEKLSGVLQDALLISKVSRSTQLGYHQNGNAISLEEVAGDPVLDDWYHANDDDEYHATDTFAAGAPSSSTAANFLSRTQNESIQDLLGEWEELELKDDSNIGDLSLVDLSAIIQFRASVGLLDIDTPYSHAFGVAKTRTNVIDNAQSLYARLLKKQQYLQKGRHGEESGTILRFHTIALAALKDRHRFDHQLCKDLVTLFRPARNGDISLLEFCKSIDSQYKELRKLRASIANEGRVNTAAEMLVNFAFYSIMIIVGLLALGV